ncbi:MAG: MFS transporter [Lachnospiraceae bacterium]|nr:MFS transporter [Lachnospiraceae bacterium]
MKKRMRKRALGILLVITTVAGIFIAWEHRMWFGSWGVADCAFEAVVYASRDAGGRRLVLDQSGERFSFVSGEDVIEFQRCSSAYGVRQFSKVIAGNDGTIYLLGNTKSDANHIDQEMVITCSQEGQYLETYLLCTYEQPRLSCSIMGIYLMDDRAVIAQKLENSIVVRALTGEVIGTYAYEGAQERLASAAIDARNGQLYVVQYNGIIVSIDMADGGQRICYDASHVEKSVPRDISVDRSGTVYVTDIGTRECFILGRQGRVDIREWEESMPFLERDICYFIDATHGLTAVSENKLHIYKDAQVRCIETAAYSEAMLAAQNWELFGCVLVAACIGCYLLSAIYYFVKKASQYARFALVITTGTILVAGMVTLVVIPRYIDRVLEATLARAQVASGLTASALPTDAMRTLKTPSDFDSEAYDQIRMVVRKHFITEDEWINDLYCTIYMVLDDVITAVYCIQEDTGVIYPYGWDYEGSDEQEIMTTGEGKVYTSSYSSEGNYLFTLNPVFDEDGSVVGLIEVGTDTDVIYEEIYEILFDLLLHVAALTVVIILVSIELLSFVHPRMREDKNASLVPNNVLRLCVFLIFFVTNISTSFLPIYSMTLAKGINGIPKEIIAAIPISAEVVAGAVMSLLGANVVRRMGVRRSAVCCSLLIAAGFFIRLAPTIWMLILSNIVIGIGWGVVLLIINTAIAQKEDEQKDIGFADYSAAALNGVNCGVVFGGFMVGVLDAVHIFLLTGIFSVVIVALVWRHFRRDSLKSEEHEISGPKKSLIYFLTRKRIWTFLLMIVFPVIACGYYLNYMYPILGESYGLQESYIGYSYLLNGICVISFSTLLTNVMEKHFKKQYAMGIGVLIYAAAFFMVGTYQNIWVLLLSLILLGIADSFALPMQTSYFTDLKEVEDYGYDRAIGVYSLFENGAQSAGSFIFGSVLLLGVRQGLYVMIGITLGLAVVFVLIAGIETVSDRKERGAKGG